MTPTEPIRADSDARDTEERRLIRLSVAGDHEAFRQLIQPYYQLIIRAAYRALGHADAAEDVAQEVFIKVFRSLHSYRHEKPFLHWLHRVAANTITDALRARRNVLSMDAMVQLPASEADGPLRLALASELRSSLRRAIADLPPVLAETLLLRVHYGLRYAEIADVMEIPIGTVMSRLHKAKARLRRALQDQLPDRFQSDEGNNS